MVSILSRDMTCSADPPDQGRVGLFLFLHCRHTVRIPHDSLSSTSPTR
jgi:hypothetical protein